MNLQSYCDKQLRVNDCVSVSVMDYGGGSSTYEGMIIKTTENKICVLFTDGDICNYERGSNHLTLLKPNRSFTVGEKILAVLAKMEDHNKKLEEQKAKIQSILSGLSN